MNAMSALYHIAQNEPPSLNHNGSWSANFYSFVDVCLAKDPTNRPTSHESVSHPFLSNYSQSGSGILIELVQRTKEAVVKLDNLQYRRMMKFFLHESVSAPMTETSSLDSEDVDSVVILQIKESWESMLSVIKILNQIKIFKVKKIEFRQFN